MVENNIPLVKTLLFEFLSKRPQFQYLHDDLLAAGYERLTTSVNNLPEMSTETLEKSIPSYLSKGIVGSFTLLIDSEQTIRVPARTYRHKKAKGEPITPLKQVSMPNIENHNLDRDGAVDPRSVLMVWDELGASCEDDTDLIIVRMRANGHNDEEIADYLGISKTQVFNRRKKIQQRFEQRQND